MMSTAATRCGLDQLSACAVPSIAAAMVIHDTCQKLFTIFSFGRPSQGNVNKE
jgi:hypothetical protein